MKTVDISKATATLAEYARGVGLEPLIVVDHKEPVAALVPLDRSQDLEDLSLATNPKFIGLIERSRRRHESEGGIPLDEVRKRLGVKKKPSRTRSRSQKK